MSLKNQDDPTAKARLVKTFVLLDSNLYRNLIGGK
jgi:hypothetical protein